MESSEELDLAVIGAGFSGICALIRARQNLPKVRVAVFEKENSMAGTWAKNTYPGLSCDIPSQLYSYSFALNPEWPNTYASQPEILAYLERVVSSFNVTGHIRLGQECTGAEWLDGEFLWRIKFIDKESGHSYTKHSRFLITAVGFCDVPNGSDDILNIENFRGNVFHSANWDHSFDFQDKNVVVVGNGCSANQFIPYLVNQSSVQSLTQVVRSPHWIAPKDNGIVPQWQKWLFRNFPISNRLWRFCIAVKLDLVFAAFRTDAIGKVLRKAIQRSIGSYMRRTAPLKYHDILIPDFDFGAKRPVLDHGYLNALHSPRMKLLRSGSLAAIGPREIQADGAQILQADAIILANGFKTQELLAPMVITGHDGEELPKLWQRDGNFASAYMGVCVAGFPNLFVLTGPNTLPSGHSTLASIECSVEYILRVISPLTKEPKMQKGARIQVRPSAQGSFNNWIQAKMQGLIYTANVQNWYVDRRSGRNTLIWPGTQLSFWWSRCVRKPRWSDFEIESRD